MCFGTALAGVDDTGFEVNSMWTWGNEFQIWFLEAPKKFLEESRSILVLRLGFEVLIGFQLI